jgi:hypothetical protein
MKTGAGPKPGVLVLPEEHYPRTYLVFIWIFRLKAEATETEAEATETAAEATETEAEATDRDGVGSFSHRLWLPISATACGFRL